MGRLKELWQEQLEAQEMGDMLEEANEHRILSEAAEIIAKDAAKLTTLMELLWQAR